MDTYAHAPSPNDIFFTVDDAYLEWFKKKFPGRPISRKYVLPFNHALQGHPESGKMWMHFIDNILIKKMEFKTTTHDRCIYRKVFDDEVIYILQQINDCIAQTKREERAKNNFNITGTKMRFASKEKKRIIPFEYLGIEKDYNGVDIKQTSHYIGVSCESYIKRLYKSHDWDATISTLDIDDEVNQLQVQHARESTINPEIDKKVLFTKALYRPNRMTPMPSDYIEKMYSEMGYKEGTAEHKVLKDKAGFAYCTLLGEIIYAYMTC